jgi:hypothetical protein
MRFAASSRSLGPSDFIVETHSSALTCRRPHHPATGGRGPDNPSAWPCEIGVRTQACPATHHCHDLFRDGPGKRRRVTVRKRGGGMVDEDPQPAFAAAAANPCLIAAVDDLDLEHPDSGVLPPLLPYRGGES